MDTTNTPQPPQKQRSKLAGLIAELYDSSLGRTLIWGGIFVLLIPTATFAMHHGAKAVLAFKKLRSAVGGSV